MPNSTLKMRPSRHLDAEVVEKLCKCDRVTYLPCKAFSMPVCSKFQMQPYTTKPPVSLDTTPALDEFHQTSR